ncbi:phage baseplate assembly protein V, partial [Campylobacter jejuni]|nr:phage baseplate assembly protein V [Campylobacter jejuni]
GNLQVSGNISDSKGDLTNHTHSCTDGATAVSR